MTDFFRIDPETGDTIPCDGKTVICTNENCFNFGIPIEVADDPNGVVMCGPCGAEL